MQQIRVGVGVGVGGAAQPYAALGCLTGRGDSGGSGCASATEDAEKTRAEGQERRHSLRDTWGVGGTGRVKVRVDTPEGIPTFARDARTRSPRCFCGVSRQNVGFATNSVFSYIYGHFVHR